MKNNLKQFALSLLSITISIGLTFGVAAIIDHNRSQKEKREIVMMVMYDMYNSLKVVEEADARIHESMELQLQIVEDTSLFEEKRIMMVINIPTIEYTETVENIFSSNIETISTVGNVFFTEKVAEFYNARHNYKKNISDSVYSKFFNETSFSSLEGLLGINYYPDAIMSNSLLWDMRRVFQLCQQIMDVSDEEIADYIARREKVEENMMDIQESKNSAMKELNELRTKINIAKEKLK